MTIQSTVWMVIRLRHFSEKKDDFSLFTFERMNNGSFRSGSLVRFVCLRASCGLVAFGFMRFFPVVFNILVVVF